MVRNARTLQTAAATGGPGAGPWQRAAEARRREVLRLLEDIRSDRPTAKDIAEAVERACEDELAPDRVQRIAGSVLALYR